MQCNFLWGPAECHARPDLFWLQSAGGKIGGDFALGRSRTQKLLRRAKPQAKTRCDRLDGTGFCFTSVYLSQEQNGIIPRDAKQNALKRRDERLAGDYPVYTAAACQRWRVEAVGNVCRAKFHWKDQNNGRFLLGILFKGSLDQQFCPL